MPRGFGRGAKSVAIVTHAQSSKGKVPRGLRGVGRKKKARSENRMQRNSEARAEIIDNDPELPAKSFAQQVAGIHIPHIINKRQKGLKSLRKEILNAVKEIHRSRNNKSKAKKS